MKDKLFALVVRAMEDVRGLDYKYSEEEESDDLVDVLKSIANHTVDEIMVATGHECYKEQGTPCPYKCQGLCRNSC
jgi:hypothetical protein